MENEKLENSGISIVWKTFKKIIIIETKEVIVQHIFFTRHHIDSIKYQEKTIRKYELEL